MTHFEIRLMLKDPRTLVFECIYLSLLIDDFHKLINIF